jgi:hypothetical protein
MERLERAVYALDGAAASLAFLSRDVEVRAEQDLVLGREELVGLSLLMKAVRSQVQEKDAIGEVSSHQLEVSLSEGE